MLCGTCPFTDGMCYTSNPPKRKCTITDEFHLYDDECNCESIRISRTEEREHIFKKLESPLIAINSLDHKDPSIAFSDIESETLNSITAEPIVGETSCLVCGERIYLNIFGSGIQICKTCKKAILYIKEKFSKELENYEVQGM